VTDDLDANVGVVVEHTDGAIERGLAGLGDLGRVELELDALDDAGPLAHWLGDLVGAAVLVLETVVGLGLGDALVDGVGDAVAVLVADRAAIGLDAGLVGARVLGVDEAVLVGVARRTAVGRDAGRVGAVVAPGEEAVLVTAGVGRRPGPRLGANERGAEAGEGAGAARARMLR